MEFIHSYILGAILLRSTVDMILLRELALLARKRPKGSWFMKININFMEPGKGLIYYSSCNSIIPLVYRSIPWSSGRPPRDL